MPKDENVGTRLASSAVSDAMNRVPTNIHMNIFSAVAKKIQRLLFSFARSRLARGVIGWLFAHMSFAIPVQRLRETSTLLAFYHPKPSYAVHILLVPKRAIPSLSELKPEDTAFTADLFQTVQSLVAELGLEARGYRLICNGGAYQDVPMLHFHLISGDTLSH